MLLAAPCTVRSMPANSDEHKQRLRQCLQTLQPYPAGQFAGRGIVVCAGGPSLFTNAYVLIHALRHLHNCRLPIQVWHFGDGEMSGRMRLLLHELETETVDAEAVLKIHPAAIENGWQLKSYALMWSRFEQVLMLDADQVPLRDPADLFRWQNYRDAGAVFWPDCADVLAANPIWQGCGLQPRAHPALDSGQLLIDKSRHWKALQIAAHLNEQASYYYGLLYGDKDTYLIAFLLAGSDFSLVPHRPISDVPFCLQQRDMKGGVLFQHRTGAKWRYSGAQILQGLPIENDCLGVLQELRGRWNGRVFNPPPRSRKARDVEARLTAARHFSLVCLGHEPLELELLAESELGAGRSTDRMNWHCEETGGAVELVFSDAFSPSVRLVRDRREYWLGTSTDGREMHLTQSAASHEPLRTQRDRNFAAFRAAWPMPGRYNTDPELEI